MEDFPPSAEITVILFLITVIRERSSFSTLSSVDNLPFVTGITQTKKLQTMGVNPETRHGPHFIVKLFDGRNPDIVTPVAVFADKMIMRMHHRIKMA